MLQTRREEQIVAETLQEFGELQTWRNVFAAHWDEAAQLVLPTSRNTFMFGNFNWPGEKKTRQQIDATGMLAVSRFGAICDSLLTPRNQRWHKLEASDPYVMKDRDTRLWFEDATRILFEYRYAPTANFTAQNQFSYQQLGVFGNGPLFIDEFDGAPGLRYRGCPLGEWFFKENHQGIIDGGIRWFRLTAEQAIQKWKGRVPEQIVAARDKKSQQPFNFLHRICLRDDYDSNRLDERGKKFASYYVSVEGKALMEEGGYHSFPVAIARYEQGPQEVYARGPAMQVLPSLKTLNAQKTVFLKQGHRAADPVLLTTDDGLLSMNLKPGALNAGGMSAKGERLVDILPTGDIQITKEMMAEERSIINDAFLVSLFQILTESPQMTATEVIEKTKEKGILLAPTVGRQQDEYLGPTIDRELDILARQRLLPPMPPRLAEAAGSYKVKYTSPMSRAMEAQDAAGFIRTLEVATNVGQVTQDPSVFDRFDFDTALPEIARINATPERWMADDNKVAEKRKARQEAAARQEAIAAAPAQAAIMKAQKATGKAA